MLFIINIGIQPHKEGPIILEPCPLALTRTQGFTEFAVTPSDRDLGEARREKVIPKDHPIRTPDLPGVYVYFAGNRCLYVGKASFDILVGRALDYLFKPGDRPQIYTTVRTYADRLFVRKYPDDAAARRKELELIVKLEPVLNEGLIYATAQDRDRFQL
jgi:hypothetical protein